MEAPGGLIVLSTQHVFVNNSDYFDNFKVLEKNFSAFHCIGIVIMFTQVDDFLEYIFLWEKNGHLSLVCLLCPNLLTFEK